MMRWKVSLVVLLLLVCMGIACAQDANTTVVADTTNTTAVTNTTTTTDVVNVPTSNETTVADSLLSKLQLRNGVFYSVLDSTFEYVGTVQVLDLKSTGVKFVQDLQVEVGYSPKYTALAVVSYPLLNLKNMGVKIPVLDLIECNVGAGVGVKRIAFSKTGGNNEFDFGVTATLINLKW